MPYRYNILMQVADFCVSLLQNKTNNYSYIYLITMYGLWHSFELLNNEVLQSKHYCFHKPIFSNIMINL